MSKLENKNYYDEFSSWYENKRGKGYHAMIDNLELQTLKPYIHQKRVLEVGCGTGLIMKELQESATLLKGVDISPKMLKKAKERGLDVVEGSAENLPFCDEAFDVVYSFKVLAHVKEIKKALKEMTRVLKPGGIMLAEFYNAHSIRKIARAAGGPGKISSKKTDADVFTRWDTPKKIKSYMPSNQQFLKFGGVRIFTPMAAAHKIPLIAPALCFAEKLAKDSFLAPLGGFLIAICQKTEE